MMEMMTIYDLPMMTIPTMMINSGSICFNIKFQWRSNLRLDEGLVEAITPQVRL